MPVLVTGTSSGIGREITEHLSRKGHLVYATVREEAAVKNLERLTGVVPMLLDVTRRDSIENVVKQISELGRGLYGLVNNAGITSFGPLAIVPLDEMKQVLEVNILGPYAMVNACFPFLVESGGRIVNISSVEGFLYEVFDGAYVISKHALEAYTDTLRDELAPLGIDVIAIEPGGFRTKLISNLLERKGMEYVDQLRNSPYRDMINDFVSHGLDSEGGFDLVNRPLPGPVAEKVCEALFTPSPKARYVVGSAEDVRSIVEHFKTLIAQLNAEVRDC